MKVSDYLEKLQQSDESIFPMDSADDGKTKKKKKPLKYYVENNSKHKKRAMIDLDGTIHKYSKGWQDGTIYDDPFNGAKETIDWLRKMQFEIIIFSTRASKENAEEMGGDHLIEINKIENYLKDHDIYFDKITAEKLGADFYIDDKAIWIENGDWNKVRKEIEKRI